MEIHALVGIVVPFNCVFFFEVEVRMSFSASAFWLLPMSGRTVESFFHAKQIVV